MDEKYRQLLELPLEGGSLVILTHDNPDPDSLASAAAMRYLLREKRNIDTTIAYSGIIGRAENRAMVALLDFPLEHLSSLDLDSFKYMALVDAQPDTGNNAVPLGHRPDIVIDHHPLREATREARFFDVRPELGASATLLTHYLRLAKLDIPRDLATALLYGISSETQDLGREAAHEDLDAYQFLFSHADPAKLAAISRPMLDRRYYSELGAALSSLLAGTTRSICPLGVVDHPDFVPEMADFAVRMEGIVWSLAYGVHEKKVYLSIRTNDVDGNAGEIMQKMLEGIGRGGGHGMRGGGNIELNGGQWPDAALDRTLRERFLRLTGDANEPLQPVQALSDAEAHPAFGRFPD